MKHNPKKIISFVLCLSLLFIGIGNFNKSKAAIPTYTDSGKTYSARQILSDYQFFTKNYFKNHNHFVGALACGGDADFGSFGNGAIVPSYINNVEHSGNYSGQYNSHFLASYPKYQGLLKQPAYYKTISTPNDSLTQYPDKKGDYINFKTAFDTLKAESIKMKENSDIVLSYKNLKHAYFDNQYGNLLTIPFSSSVKSVYIPFNIISKTDWIMIDGVKDLDELVSTDHIITIGLSDLISLGGDYSYTFSGDTCKAVFISTKNKDGRSFSFPKSNFIQKAYLLEDGHGLKTLQKSETIQAGQMDLSGMKLIWNFPYNSLLTCKYLPGHVLAPNAIVTIEGGNFEGGYIADSIINFEAEGHFYPYNEITKPKATPTPNCSKTPASSTTPAVTPPASITPSVAPTITPAVSATPSQAPTKTPIVSVTPSTAPAITPPTSITPSATPATTPPASITPSATPATTPSASITPSATPTVTPMVSPTPEVFPSAAPTPAPAPTPSFSRTPIPWIPSPTVTPSIKPTATPVPSNTVIPSKVPNVTSIPTITVTPSVKPDATIKPAATPTVTASNTPAPSVTPYVTLAPTDTFPPSVSPSADIPSDKTTPSNTNAPKKVSTPNYPSEDEPQLPSGQKGSPSTGEKNQAFPFVMITIISGLGILFFSLKIISLKKFK